MIEGGRGTWSHIRYKYTAWPVLPHIGKAIIKTVNFKRLLLCVHSISVGATPSALQSVHTSYILACEVNFKIAAFKNLLWGVNRCAPANLRCV